MRTWAMIPVWFLGLLFLLMPTWLALGTAALWTVYGVGLVCAVAIGLLARRWIRVTTVESGRNHRVVRIDHLRGQKRSSEES